MTTITYISSDCFVVRNHDKEQRVTALQLTGIGTEIVEIAHKARQTPGKPVVVPGARDARPRHSKVYSHILQ